MKKIIKITTTVAAISLLLCSCVEEFEPLGGTTTKEQTSNAPGAFDNFVNSITSTLCGEFVYAPGSTSANDFGYPSFYLQRDVMGQDIFQSKLNWFSGWYTCTYLGSNYRNSQIPWTYYYTWIKSCNTVLSLAGDKPTEKQKSGTGIAHAMRALFYMDLARMYAPKTYGLDKNAETVPIITEKTANTDLPHNPRATNEKMWAFIIADLDKAEEYLAKYNRKDVYSPDISVVYGLKARAYLVMEDWNNAKKYAKMAQEKYSIMTENEYTSRENGFNSPNSSWMFACQYQKDSPNILKNDGDSSWGSMMILEINPKVSGCGYAANYGQPFVIDRHLYETMPESDFRKNCFVDFKIDELKTKAEKIKALEKYSDYPEWVYLSGENAKDYEGRVGGLPLKFRAAGGKEGRDNQYVGFTVSVPMMRVEEMYLIEAEAAGMLNEAEGINLLTTFAKKRDSKYQYGNHNEAYGNNSTSAFQNEVWWQRRVEFWGEGFATFDIKRLNKGIIRSYPNSNHFDDYRWNTTVVPEWMNLTIVQTETNYNYDCTNNPDPIAPTGNSPEHSW